MKTTFFPFHFSIAKTRLQVLAALPFVALAASVFTACDKPPPPPPPPLQPPLPWPPPYNSAGNLIAFAFPHHTLISHHFIMISVIQRMEGAVKESKTGNRSGSEFVSLLFI